MKRFIVLALVIAFVLPALAQTKPKTPVAKPRIKPAPVKATPLPVKLNSLVDSANYAMGLSAALSLKQEGINNLKPDLCAKGINDIQSGTMPLFDDQTGYNVWMRYSAKVKEAQTKPVAKAGTTVKKPKPATRTVPANALLKSSVDSVSYAIGMNRALFARQQGITNLNPALFSRGMKDIMTGAAPVFNDAVAYEVMNTYLTKLEQEKAAPNIKAGEDFLAENKKRPGVITTASGLQYEIIKDSAGIKPTVVDTFVCHYRGTLLNGTQFDASYDRGEPLKMGMKEVIRGWTEGLQLMGTGSRYKFYVPYTLGYGPFDNGQVPGGSLMIFDLELLDVKKAGHE